MIIVRTVEALRAERERLEGTTSFVPTMGALHQGHLSLMAAGRAAADHLVVSIFVNPTQFNQEADLASYPRDEAGDLAKCEQAGADLVFIPGVEQMYPSGPTLSTRVSVAGLTDNLCGRTRPGHFDGVTTVVSKLFHLVQPDVAVFGQKDYQQLAIIHRMVRDLDFPIEILGAPTLREPDGLAISSRNQLLDASARKSAVALSAGLRAAAAAYDEGQRDVGTLEQLVRTPIEAAGLLVDYVETVHPITLARLASVDTDGATIAVAAFAGDVRLIDNVVLG